MIPVVFLIHGSVTGQVCPGSDPWALLANFLCNLSACGENPGLANSSVNLPVSFWGFLSASQRQVLTSFVTSLCQTTFCPAIYLFIFAKNQSAETFCKYLLKIALGLRWVEQPPCVLEALCSGPSIQNTRPWETNTCSDVNACAHVGELRYPGYWSSYNDPVVPSLPRDSQNAHGCSSGISWSFSMNFSSQTRSFIYVNISGNLQVVALL